MAEQDLDRHHDATPFKLRQARNRGSVARSQDVASAALIAVAVVWCHAMVPRMVGQWANTQARWWNTAAWFPLDQAKTVALASDFLLSWLYLLAPLLAVLVIVAILSGLVQSGPVFSMEPVKPNFNRINPAEGFKRLMSLKTLYMAFKSVVKLLALGIVFWLALGSLLDQLLVLPWMSPRGYVAQMAAFTGGLLTKLWLVLLVLAILDLAYTRWEFARQMRMSQRELKEEVKQREGDPRIRRRLREIRVEMLRRAQALRKVPSADVLITNPTRVAVALKYDRSRGHAPTVVAKGAGTLARRMRELAWRHQVTVVQNPPLARSLYRHVDIDGAVPPNWYATVAKILVWAHATRTSRSKATGMTGAAA
jgi:flagellar biosynthetic protein FlhB